MARSPLLLEGLRSAGVDAPREATLIIRATGGDPAKVAPMLAELLAENVDVIVPLSPEMVRAVRAATSTIPIVTFDLESDPEESGFLKSFAHPGGNITGLFLDFPDFARVLASVVEGSNSRPREARRHLGPDHVDRPDASRCGCGRHRRRQSECPGGPLLCGNSRPPSLGRRTCIRMA